MSQRKRTHAHVGSCVYKTVPSLSLSVNLPHALFFLSGFLISLSLPLPPLAKTHEHVRNTPHNQTSVLLSLVFSSVSHPVLSFFCISHTSDVFLSLLSCISSQHRLLCRFFRPYSELDVRLDQFLKYVRPAMSLMRSMACTGNSSSNATATNTAMRQRDSR